MSVIVVHRPRELWINHFGKFTILVNGKIVGKVKRGETKTFSGVSSGSVRVRAVIDWLGSRTIILNLSDHDVAHLEVTNGSLLALLEEREHYLDLRLTPESTRFEKPDLAASGGGHDHELRHCWAGGHQVECVCWWRGLDGGVLVPGRWSGVDGGGVDWILMSLQTLNGDQLAEFDEDFGDGVRGGSIVSATL